MQWQLEYSLLLSGYIYRNLHISVLFCSIFFACVDFCSQNLSVPVISDYTASALRRCKSLPTPEVR